MACLIAKRFFVLCERVFLYLPTPVRRFAICVLVRYLTYFIILELERIAESAKRGRRHRLFYDKEERQWNRLFLQLPLRAG